MGTSSFLGKKVRIEREKRGGGHSRRGRRIWGMIVRAVVH